MVGAYFLLTCTVSHFLAKKIDVFILFEVIEKQRDKKWAQRQAKSRDENDYDFCHDQIDSAVIKLLLP